MKIGLDQWCARDHEWWPEIGATWTKESFAGIGEGTVDEGFAGYAQDVAEHGITLIADLRPSSNVHLAITRLRHQTGDDADAELADILKRIEDDTAAWVASAGDYCTHWEWWGEYDCPYVGGMWPGKGTAYPHLLEAFRRGVKAAQPDGEVWNGGYGVNFQPQFLDGLVQLAPQSFDAANWHHYNITDYWPRHTVTGEFQFATPLHKCVDYTARMFRDMFEQSRARMSEAGCTQPFVSSEWGMPTVDDDTAAKLKLVGLHSHVFADGVFGLGETDASYYLDSWLNVFHDVGFRVLNYHRLRDSSPMGVDDDGTFWGVYCGLLFLDGSPKTKIIEVLKHWAARGNAA